MSKAARARGVGEARGGGRGSGRIPPGCGGGVDSRSSWSRARGRRLWSRRPRVEEMSWSRSPARLWSRGVEAPPGCSREVEVLGRRPAVVEVPCSSMVGVCRGIRQGDDGSGHGEGTVRTMTARGWGRGTRHGEGDARRGEGGDSVGGYGGNDVCDTKGAM
ncbi:hypothetical protein BD626DRAFT_206491 [Schizophyllum amplum]|uniref:Uncharacterized protein n=1 Tax=Schizophyllum amplum TaxID=97359 RepID=A0A550BZ50_9AGAR|nr:hypothetical protein BD626DRAFT_206491 [Auriculariopsis ampla]